MGPGESCYEPASENGLAKPPRGIINRGSGKRSLDASYAYLQTFSDIDALSLK